MSQWGWVALGWAVTAVTLIGYAAMIIVRGRVLTRRVPPQERRWL
jgi:hypothetical protein